MRSKVACVLFDVHVDDKRRGGDTKRDACHPGVLQRGIRTVSPNESVYVFVEFSEAYDSVHPAYVSDHCDAHKDINEGWMYSLTDHERRVEWHAGGDAS